MFDRQSRVPRPGMTLIVLSWLYLALSFFGAFSLGMILPSMQKMFGFGLDFSGTLSSVTYVTQIIVFVPLALVAIRVNPKYVIGALFVSLALAFFMLGFARGEAMLLVGRILMAVAQAGITAPLVMVKTSWLPSERLGEFNGYEQFSSTFGQLLGTAGVATLIAVLGNWQNMLNVLGLLAFALILCWFFLYRENPVRPIELPKHEPLLVPLRAAVREKTVWLLAFGMGGTGLVWIAFNNFWPTFAVESLHLSLGQAGVVLGMIPLGSTISCLIAPFMAKWIGYDKLMIWPWSLVLVFLYRFALSTAAIPPLCVIFFLIGFCAYAFVPIAMTTLYKLPKTNPSLILVSTGVLLSVANIGNALAGLIIGRIGDLKTALELCSFSPLLLFATSIFLPELGRKHAEKMAEQEESPN